ncbi:hypothetical protein EVAR_87522_1 [Eumeta japonica]|uniref:Uncharacterized protein n=1 Tax=Eumeta variegata TaxID=151549 RepID=A0A4C1XNP2_EUMVA|nr:hypothetical protein EVAR_87522_1 [Eumeta japonica]
MAVNVGRPRDPVESSCARHSSPNTHVQITHEDENRYLQLLYTLPPDLRHTDLVRAIFETATSKTPSSVESHAADDCGGQMVRPFPLLYYLAPLYEPPHRGCLLPSDLLSPLLARKRRPPTDANKGRRAQQPLCTSNYLHQLPAAYLALGKVLSRFAAMALPPLNISDLTI